MFPLRSLIRRLSKKAPTPILSATFGKIHFFDFPGLQFWQNPSTTFWGFEDVELVVRADVSGPSVIQERAFLEVRDAETDILPRCLETLEASLPLAVARPEAPIRVVSVVVPSLQLSDDGQIWNLVLEDQNMREFRIASTDAWGTMALTDWD